MCTRSSFPERLHVVLVTPLIPWNTGNAGRTCLAAGARLHLVEPLGFSLDDRQLKRAGLDYWPSVPLTLWPSWTRLEAALEHLGEPLFFSAEGSRELWQTRIPARAALVFGNETQGLPESLRRRHSGRLVRIPQPGEGVRSLNLSTSVGIALFESLRQQQAPESAP
jgi:tRNA (cytidine/uridine-2'-O-)-methyltransferase